MEIYWQIHYLGGKDADDLQSRWYFIAGIEDSTRDLSVWVALTTKFD